MLKLIRTVVFVLGVSGVVTGTQGVEVPRPRSGYSAVRTIEFAGNTMESTVYAEGLKERSEMSLQGQSMTMIMRQDMDVIWVLMPGGMYMEQSMNGPAAGPMAAPPTLNDNSTIIEFVEEGADQVNGFDTTRFRFSARNADGSVLNGRVWLDDDNIALRTSMTVEAQGQTSDVTMELRDLELGDQPDTLFEVPDGYQKLSIPGLPGLNE